MAHQLPKMKIHLEVLRLASFNIKFCQNEKKMIQGHILYKFIDF
jgi:hypothetical protein